MTGRRLFLRGVVALGAAAVSAASVPGPRAQDRALEDLMIDFNIAPLQPHAPPPLSVTTLDGGRVTLDDVKGRAVLVYFWATW